MGGKEEEEEEEKAQEALADALHQLVDASDFASSVDFQPVVDVVDDQVVGASLGWRPRHPRSPREPPWLERSQQFRWDVPGRRSENSCYSWK